MGDQVTPRPRAAGSAGEAVAERQCLLEVDDLVVHFPTQRRTLLGSRREVVRAVDGVTFSIGRGETLGLVGESGCGKSTTGRAVVGLYRPTSGRVLFDGHNLARLSNAEMQPLRRRFQIVFQDPFSSLNPRMTVGALVGEALAIHNVGKPAERPARVAELMDLVGLSRTQVSRYPHEFSGGQRQRIAIARALASTPELVVLDEPVSALDVSIQSQILRLLSDLQRQLGLTYLLIAHDLAVVGQMSQRIAVMYLGLIVEHGSRDEVYRLPLHPYTRALFSAVPVPDPKVERTRQRIVLSGDVPSPINPPSGCRFHTRCPLAQERCRREVPALRELESGHRVACHFAEAVAAMPFQVSGSPAPQG